MTVNDPTQLIEEGAAAMRLSGPGPRRAGPRRASFDVIVIGAGQAGLAVGYHLARAGVRFVILEAHARIGDAWRARWDSLRLFTPAKFDGLPGMAFPAPRHYFPTKDEMADYLEAYARRFALPVRTGVRVERLSQRGMRYVVASRAGEFEAPQVVVAMAKYQQGRVPAFAACLSDQITQLHSQAYRNPAQLRPGPALLVGAGNSGADIALEAARAGHVTYLSGRDTGQVPFRPEGFLGLHLLQPLVLRLVFHRLLTVHTALGRRVRPAVQANGGPLIRVKRADLHAAGVQRVARVAGVRDGAPLLADGRTLKVANVIWCSGFEAGFEWIELPVFDAGGAPRHRSGIADEQPGLYFVGLPFLHAMSSSMIHGVGRDAARIARAILRARACPLRVAAPAGAAF